MDWNGWVGRHVKIILTDGYCKYGMMVGADSNFVEIEYERATRRERLAISTIASIKEQEGRQ